MTTFTDTVEEFAQSTGAVELAKKGFEGRNEVLFAVGVGLIVFCLLFRIILSSKTRKKKGVKRFFRWMRWGGIILILASLIMGLGFGFGGGSGFGFGKGNGTGTSQGTESGKNTDVSAQSENKQDAQSQDNTPTAKPEDPNTSDTQQDAGTQTGTDIGTETNDPTGEGGTAVEEIPSGPRQITIRIRNTDIWFEVGTESNLCTSREQLALRLSLNYVNDCTIVLVDDYADNSTYEWVEMALRTGGYSYQEERTE